MSMVLVHVWYVGLMEHSGEIAGKIHARLFHQVEFVFLKWSELFGNLGARKLGPGSQHVVVEC